MTRRRALEHLGALQRQWLEEDDAAASTRARLQKSLQDAVRQRAVAARPEPRRKGMLLAAAAAVLVAAAAATWWYASPSDETTIWMVAPSPEARGVHLPDGSRVTWQPGSSGRMTRTAAHAVQVDVHRGAVVLDVTPARTTRWRVQAGPYTVLVTGTRFRVSWSDQSRRFALDLHRGTVTVRGPMVEQGTVVRGGHRMRADVDSQVLEIASLEPEHPAADSAPAAPRAAQRPRGADATPEDSEQPDTGARARPQAAARTHRRDAAAPRGSWVSLVRAGDYDAVLSQAEQRGIAQVLARRDAPDLMALADAARLRRRLDVAKDAYLAVRRRFAHTALAADAAFYLGKMAFNQRSNCPQAIAHLQRYVDERPNGALVQSALGMLMTCHVRTNKIEAARQIAVHYLQLYPDGPHAPSAQRLVHSAP